MADDKETPTTAAVEVPAPEAEDTKNEEAEAPKEPTPVPESIYDPDLPNRIIVGRGRPLSFYVDRARRVFRIDEEVHVTGRGDNISTACKLVEALKRQKIAVITKMSTGMDVQPYFNAAGDAKWGQPTAVILFKLKRGELGKFIADYQQRKVIEIFEANDAKCTGELAVEAAEALDLGTKFKAKDEQIAESKAFLGKVTGGKLDLPAFIKYASILIHPLLRNKVFKEVLTSEFNIEVAGVSRAGSGSGDDKEMQLVD